jgi:hypothetical protein
MGVLTVGVVTLLQPSFATNAVLDNEFVQLMMQK